jgi:hypothetical protein
MRPSESQSEKRTLGDPFKESHLVVRNRALNSLVPQLVLLELVWIFAVTLLTTLEKVGENAERNWVIGTAIE